MTQRARAPLRRPDRPDQRVRVVAHEAITSEGLRPCDLGVGIDGPGPQRDVRGVVRLDQLLVDLGVEHLHHACPDGLRLGHHRLGGQVADLREPVGRDIERGVSLVDHPQRQMVERGHEVALQLAARGEAVGGGMGDGQGPGVVGALDLDDAGDAGVRGEVQQLVERGHPLAPEPIAEPAPGVQREQLLERVIDDRSVSAGGPVERLVVDGDQVTVGGQVDIRFDGVHARLRGRPKGSHGVLGIRDGVAAVGQRQGAWVLEPGVHGVLAARSGSDDGSGLGDIGRVRWASETHRLLELQGIRPHVREADAGVGWERQPDTVAALGRHLIGGRVRDDVARRRARRAAGTRHPGRAAARPRHRPSPAPARSCRSPHVARRRSARVGRPRGCGRGSCPCPGPPCAARSPQVTSPAVRSVTVAGSRLAAPTNDATKGVAGAAVQLLRWPCLLDASSAHHDHLVGDRERLLLVVGDIHGW